MLNVAHIVDVTYAQFAQQLVQHALQLYYLQFDEMLNDSVITQRGTRLSTLDVSPMHSTQHTPHLRPVPLPAPSSME
jgi:hypothetical protein